MTTNSTADPIFMPDEFLTVVVEDDHPVEFGWNSRTYTVAPNKPTFVLAPAVINKVGDPRAIRGDALRLQSANWPDPILIPSAEGEILRLRALYGKSMDEDPSTINPAGCPKIRVYYGPPEEPNRLFHILEDPAREHVTPVITTMDERTVLEAQLNEAMRRLEALERKEALRTSDVPEDDLEDLHSGFLAPADDPAAQVPSELSTDAGSTRGAPVTFAAPTPPSMAQPAPTRLVPAARQAVGAEYPVASLGGVEQPRAGFGLEKPKENIMDQYNAGLVQGPPAGEDMGVPEG